MKHIYRTSTHIRFRVYLLTLYMTSRTVVVSSRDDCYFIDCCLTCFCVYFTCPSIIDIHALLFTYTRLVPLLNNKRVTIIITCPCLCYGLTCAATLTKHTSLCWTRKIGCIIKVCSVLLRFFLAVPLSLCIYMFIYLHR